MEEINVLQRRHGKYEKYKIMRKMSLALISSKFLISFISYYIIAICDALRFPFAKSFCVKLVTDKAKRALIMSG